MKLPKIELNAPVTVGFTLISFLAVIFGYATLGESTKVFFTCYKTAWTDPMQYLRLFTHIFGHADITHYVNNFTTIILLGPMLEEKYGSKDLAGMILVTALISGLVNVLFTPGVGVLGASGIVFLFIILCSCTSVSTGKIPLTLVLVVVIYIGQEILTGLTVKDQISQLGHITGGVCGIGFGLFYNMYNPKKEA
jgi:GlpG protein